MKNILLLGPKHCGKTSAGIILAGLCSCPFTDIDELITEQSGKSPRSLFTEGPEIFRKAETAALMSLVKTNSESGLRVIAAGGGIIDNPGAIALLETARAERSSGSDVTVYISVSAQTAWERICRTGALPPFLRTENPEETHRTLHRRRAEAYQKTAGIIVNGEGKNPEEIAREIFSRL
ncbi:MAG: shikimate kinase [Treponema sp.]|jgi:shikimate kinase|nr:shikimate kinase [Treponema sp.]